jgi:hypothetical protein
MMVQARKTLDDLGMYDQDLEFRFGEGELIGRLAAVGVSSKEVAHFRPEKNTGYRGVIQINLDAVRPASLVGVVNHEASHARFHYAYNKGTRVDKFMTANAYSLMMEDGTTNYSKAWWGRVGRAEQFTGDPGPTKSAINESLAEMRKVGSLTPHYEKLDKLVSGTWAKRKQ